MTSAQYRYAHARYRIIQMATTHAYGNARMLGYSAGEALYEAELVRRFISKIAQEM